MVCQKITFTGKAKEIMHKNKYIFVVVINWVQLLPPPVPFTLSILPDPFLSVWISADDTYLDPLQESDMHIIKMLPYGLV